MKWLILLIVIFFVVLIFISNVSIKINLSFGWEENQFITSIYLFHICIYKKGKSFKQKNLDLWKTFEELAFDDLFFIENIFENMNKLYFLMVKFLHRSTINQLDWQTEIGNKDAMNTGVYTGSIWILKGFVLSLLSKQCKQICKPYISVKPHFQTNYFHSQFNCIVSIRTGHAIHILLKIITNDSLSKSAYRLK